MIDLAVLGIQVESSSTDTADQKLKKLAATSATTERATRSLGEATKVASTSTSAAASTQQAYERAMRSL